MEGEAREGGRGRAGFIIIASIGTESVQSVASRLVFVWTVITVVVAWSVFVFREF